MNPRVLILTAGYGEGHNAAARALGQAWDELHGPGSACVSDIFALVAPRANALTRRAYLGLINRAPRLWKSVYLWLDRSTVFPKTFRIFRAERRTLARVIAAEKPTAICWTYPAYAFWLQQFTRTGQMNVPFFNIVTDSISINSLWWRAGAAGWFLPNEDSADVLRRARIDPEKLHVLGFPVAPFFRASVHKLALPQLGAGASPRVLYIVNSGTRNAADTARQLLQRTSWGLTIAVGRNETLRKDLQCIADGRMPPAQILGWTDEMPRLLMTHHVVVSKAGGATTQEALAARCPMIVNQIVPGQEEGNYELLRRHGIGALAETPEAVITELERAFHSHGRVWREWRAALATLSRPQAAIEIATRVAELSHGACEPMPVPLRNPLNGHQPLSVST